MNLGKTLLAFLFPKTPDTPAHDQQETIHLLRHYEAHHPRKGDPYYPLFEKAKRKIKAQGQWKCALAVLESGDCSGPLTLHHAGIEYATQNSIDLAKINALLGLDLDLDGFRQWVEEIGNLEVLCTGHHLQGHPFSVHQIPHADWDAVRTHAAGKIPVQVVKEIP
jgi:hypothetical protein